LSQFPTRSDNRGETVVELTVVAVVGIREVQRRVAGHQRAQQHHLNGTRRSIEHVEALFAGHHDREINATEIHTISELGEGTLSRKASPLQCATSPFVHW